jgi:hypothetical protein
MFAFITAEEGDAQSDGALGMNRGELLSVDGIESAEQVELAIVIGRRIAQNCHLNVHRYSSDGFPECTALFNAKTLRRKLI